MVVLDHLQPPRSTVVDDFPKRLDGTWMKHTVAWADDATTSVRVDYRPVHTRTLTNDVRYFPPREQIR